MDAERELADLHRCRLMQDQVGRQFDGIVSAVTEFGFFVELNSPPVEGLVHLRSLTDDYYHYDPTRLLLAGERTRRQFRIGMPVQVTLERVDIPRRRMDFLLSGDHPALSGPQGGSKKTPARNKTTGRKKLKPYRR